LTEWAVQNRIGLGLGPGRVLVRHFHTSFRVDEFRQPRVDAIVQVLQRAQESEKEHGERLQGAQLWGGATIVADAGGKVRYVISKPTPGSGDRGKKRLDSFLRFAESSSEYDIVPAGQKKTRLSLDLGALHMASGGHDR
jgi:hypothetical protein